MYGARNSKWNTVSSLLLLSHISDLPILNMWDSLLLSSTCSLVIVVYESSFKLKESATKTNICRRRVTQGYTGIGVDNYLVLDTLEESCLATTLLQKTRPHTFLLRFHFMFTGNDHFPCRTWPGTVPHITTVFVHTSQCDRLDNTTRLSHGKVHETTANHARYTHRHCWTWSDMCMSAAWRIPVLA